MPASPHAAHLDSLVKYCLRLWRCCAFTAQPPRLGPYGRGVLRTHDARQVHVGLHPRPPAVCRRPRLVVPCHGSRALAHVHASPEQLDSASRTSPLTMQLRLWLRHRGAECAAAWPRPAPLCSWEAVSPEGWPARTQDEMSLSAALRRAGGGCGVRMVL